MKVPTISRDAHFYSPRISPRTSAFRISHGTMALAVAVALAGATGASAQQMQNWPPDDNYDAQSQYAPQPQYAPQQYAPPQQYAYAPQAQLYASQSQQGYAQRPLSPQELTQLVAPIALYPDPLVAQILAASTYPAQVSAADQWRRSMGNAPAEQIAAGADAQTSWDPSVKALTAFPQVLAMLDQNLQWTTSLGNAYYNQPQDTLQTIQVLRERAEQAGNLRSTPQEQVYDNQGAIDIAPANPQMVYVPAYDPWNAYGDPVTPYPGFSLLGEIGSWIGNGFMHFGPGVAMSAFLGTPWGWLGWGLDWLAHAILFHHDDYWTNSNSVRDWGFPRGGPRWGGRDWGRGRESGWDGGRGNYGSHDYGRNDGYGGSVLRPRGGPVLPVRDARSAEGFNRGFPERDVNQGREGMLAYNREPRFSGRPQSPQSFAPRQPSFGGTQNRQFDRQNYGSGMMTEPRSDLARRQGGGMAFANPGYSAPRSGSYYGAGGASQPRSFNYGGSPSYGGGHSNWSAPRENRSFNSGGHSFFGGSNHSFSGGGGHSHSSGGGHSFSGGGHSSGGGHHGGGSHGGGGHSDHHH